MKPIEIIDIDSKPIPFMKWEGSQKACDLRLRDYWREYFGEEFYWYQCSWDRNHRIGCIRYTRYTHFNGWRIVVEDGIPWSFSLYEPGAKIYDTH